MTSPQRLHLQGSQVGAVDPRSWVWELACSGLSPFVYRFSLQMVRSKWSSTIFHEPVGDSRNRDIFPLPVLATDDFKCRRVCRSVSRRLLRRARVTVMVNRAIRSLNSLYFGSLGGEENTATSIVDLPLGQRQTVASIVDAVKFLGPPPEACDPGAQKALRVAASAYYEPEVDVGDVVRLRFDQLSLPTLGAVGVDLVRAVDESIRDVVVNFEERMLQHDDVWTTLSRDTEHLTPYNDPGLKDRTTYLEFLRLLHERGILSFSQRCRGRVGAFTVSKKSKVVDGVVCKRQRLVLDCRQVNMLFRPSPHTELGSLSSLADIALGPSQQLFMSGADIQDCFYAVHIPAEMMSFFCFESDISGSEASWVSNGSWCGDGDHWSPCINVLPMGFSWSFYLVQHIHQSSVLRSLSISEDQLFLDGRPPPRLEEDKLYSMPYCDNIHCLALDREQCNVGKQQVVDDLSTQGFSIHEDEEASTFFQTLGGQLDGDKGRVSMTSRRAWDLIYAFNFVADNVVSPSVMQKLLGHAMFFSTINRAGMSVFRRLYDFVERAEGPRLLSKSEREECLTFSGLIPLLFADLRKQWSETVQCTDASPDGYGVCTRSLDAKLVESMGRWNERWRFRRLEPDQWGPRRRALGRDPFSDGHTVLGSGDLFDELDEMGANEDFPEIPFQITHPSCWKTVLMGKWRHDGAITVKEGRALALAVRRLSRSSESRGHKHLFLVDSFSLALSIHKGRAKSFELLRVNQQIAALSLASGFSVRVRWIASEHNVADGPSRGQIDPGSYRGFEAASGEKNHQFQSGFEKETCGEKNQAWEDRVKKSLFTVFEGEGDSSQESATPEEEGGEGSSSFGRRCGIPCSEEETDSVGGTVNLDRSPEPVPPVLSAFREFLPGQRIGLAIDKERRHHSCRFLGRNVFGKSLSSRWREGGGGDRVFQPSPKRGSEPLPSSSKGLAKRNASTEQASFTSPGCSRDGHDSLLKRQKVDGAETHGGSRHVPQTWGKHRFEGARYRPPCSKHRETVSLVRHRGEGCSGPSTRQDRCVRQLHSSKQSRKGVSGSAALGTGKEAQSGRRHHLPLRLRRVPKELSRGWDAVGDQEFASVPDKARGCIRRLEQWRKGPPVGEGSGSLAYGPERKKVWKSGEGAEVDGRVVTRAHGVLSVVTQKHSESAARDPSSTRPIAGLGWQDMFNQTQLPRCFAIEIFAGTARICSAFQDIGLQCFPIDICIFPSHNVLEFNIENAIKHHLQSGRVKFVWLGMPCTSFSQARKNDGIGPGPLRSYDSIWGLPGLSVADQSRVRTGNLLLRFSIRILELCEQLQIPYALENPYSSYAWHTPTIVNFIRQFQPFVEHLDFCQYGEAWKKPTTVMGNFWYVPSIVRRCAGSFRRCSASLQPHLALSGLADNGLFRTLLAQPYPKELARLVVQHAAKAIHR